MATKQATKAAAQGLVDFVNKSPSPWHAVAECKRRLLAAGFQELKEAEKWNLQPKEKYFVTRNMSTIVLFAVGGAYKPGNGFSIVGAHTDSPCMRIKPVSKVEKAGYLQVGVELYGGGTWITWFDRDLKVAGRVVVKENGKLKSKLVHINKPILRVPHLAIHLNREINSKFSPNLEKELLPVLGTVFQQQLDGGPQTVDGIQAEKHHSLLLQAISDSMGLPAGQISDFELCLADCSPATIGGALDEFIFAPRLDNLFNVYAALEAMINTAFDGSLDADPNIRVASFFDHEEIGSTSAQGANSSFQRFILQRLAADTAGGDSTSFHQAMPKSYLISADQAHAVHPNYKDKHEDNHSVEMHKGIVIKFNCKQRYATNAYTAAVLRAIAEKADVPLQDFVMRNDSLCGSTIGPLMAAQLAMPTIDVGGAQLSMHSIREQCCVTSVSHAIRLYESFYKHYPGIRDSSELE